MRNLKLAMHYAKREWKERHWPKQQVSNTRPHRQQKKVENWVWKQIFIYFIPTFALKTSRTFCFFFSFFLTFRSFRISCFFFPNVIRDYLLFLSRAPPPGRRMVTAATTDQNWDRKMADLRKICPESMPCRVNCSRKPSFQGKLFILLCVLIVDSGGATTHWVVTEDGKIQQQVWQFTLAHWPANVNAYVRWLACCKAIFVRINGNVLVCDLLTWLNQFI